MKAIRRILFIPLGILAGFLLALPFILFANLLHFGNILLLGAIYKSTITGYFIVLGMAWITPKDFNISTLKKLASITLGVLVAIDGIVLLALPNAPGTLAWGIAGEVIGYTLGYLRATRWDKNSLRALLNKIDGAHPYNAYSKSVPTEYD